MTMKRRKKRTSPSPWLKQSSWRCDWPIKFSFVIRQLNPSIKIWSDNYKNGKILFSVYHVFKPSAIKSVYRQNNRTLIFTTDQLCRVCPRAIWPWTASTRQLPRLTPRSMSMSPSGYTIRSVIFRELYPYFNYFRFEVNRKWISSGFKNVEFFTDQPPTKSY